VVATRSARAGREEWLLDAGSASRRVLLLAARVQRCGGVNRAGQLQADALALAGRMARLATIRHIDERLFDQHRQPAAWAELETALAIRTRAGTDPSPTASSAIAARRACELVGRP